MAIPLAVLIVEDSDSDAKLIIRLLDKAGYKVAYQQVETAGQLRAALEKQAWDIVISDYHLPQFDGSAALRLLQEMGLDIPFIAVSGTIGEETAVTMMKAGAHDYLMKDNLTRLAPAVERELAQAEERRERKQAEQALRESESVFRGFLEQSVDAIMLTNEQGVVIQWSKGAESLTGYSRDESIGKPLWDVQFRSAPDEFKSTEHFERIKASLQVVLLTGQGTILNQLTEAAIQRPDGIRLTTQALAFPIQTNKGFMLGSILRDITERKQAEEALRKSEQVLREAESLGHTGSWEHDLVTSKIFNTGENLRLFFGDDLSKGEPFEDYSHAVHPDDREFVLRSHALLLEGGPGDIEFRVVWPDGSVHMLFGRATVVREESGRAIRVYGTNVDITERKQAEESIKLSEERFRTLYENNTLGLYRTTPGGRILLANPSVVRMLGYTSFDELRDRNLEQEGFEPSYSRSQFLDLMEKQGEIQGLESAWERRDGSIIFVRESARATRDAEGKILYYDGTVEDITERKRAEEALRESQEHYRQIIETAHEGVWTLDTSDRTTLANQHLADMLGYTVEEMMGKSVYDFIDEEGKVIAARSLDNRRRGINERIDFKFTRKDGKVVWALMETSPLLDHNHQYLGALAMLTDITERKRAEEALQASEARYRGMFEDSPISLWEEDFSLVKQRLDSLREDGITDFEGYFISHPEAVAECAALIKVLDINKATMKMFGANRKEDIFKNLEEIFEGEPTEVLRDELINIAEGKTRFDWEGINKTVDGRQINVDLSWSIAPGYENSLSNVIVSVIDITERKQAEAALAKSEQEYRTLFENMPIGLYRTAADGRILDANQSLVKMLGYKDREALLAANIVDLYVDPASDQKFKSEIEKYDFVSNFEAEFKRPDGTSFWTEDHNRIIRDEARKPLFYEGSLIDITERRRAEKRIKQQLDHLAALRTIDQVVTSSFDLHISLSMILNQVARELGVDAADILLLNSANLFLEYGAGVGFRTKAAEKASVRLGQNYAGRVALERQLIQISDLRDQPDDSPLKTHLAGENFVCYFGIPLVAKGIVKGVLEVYHRTPLEPDQEWLDFLNTLANQAAIAIDNANLFDNLQRSNIDLTMAYDATIEGWSRAMDLRDKETEGHTLRVTEMTLELAGLFGIKDEDLVSIRRGALLHDIGKMGVPDAILLKPAALTDEEWVIMRKHPVLAFEMLSSIRYLKSAIDIPYCHHEKWDGTGYPRGLKGELIPLPARIFAIVDVWDAVTSDRPYRKAWSKEKAIEYLKAQAGMHFDPQILEVCLQSGVFERKARKQSASYR